MELLGHLSLQCVVCLKFCKSVLMIWKCVLILFPLLRLPSTWLIKNLQKSNYIDRHYSAQSDLASDHRIRAKFTILFDGYRKMFDQSFSKSKDLADMLRFLPGIVVQKPMSMQGMSDLYRVNPNLLERFIKSTIDPLRPLRAFPNSRYTLDDYLSGFLQDRERSRLRYCDPMLQHISICRRLLSFLDGSNAFDLPS